MATLVLGTMLVTATQALGTAAVAHEQLVNAPVTAWSLAREVHSLALVLPRDAGDGLPAADAASVELLEDLDGATFSPPIGADKSQLAFASGWTQLVAVQAVNLANPSVLAADPTAPGTLLRLTVALQQDGELRGTYVWWMNP